MRSGRWGLSLSQQWLLIAVVTMIPVLSVVSYATWSFYQQMQVQRTLVSTSDRISDLQASINERVREIERYARQYRLLREESFLLPYREKQEELRDNLQAMRIIESALLVGQISTVANVQQQGIRPAIERLENLLVRLDDAEISTLEDEPFSEFLAALGQFRPEFDRIIAGLQQELNEKGERELHRILWNLSKLGLVSLPLTLALMGLGFMQMMTPIRRLSWAIINLGHGYWRSPIAISGPKDLQALGDRLEWMRGQLLEAEDQKKSFLRHVSHELKTPLSAIMEAGSLLHDEVPGKINAKQREVLQILLANSQNLRELIQQLLNYNVITHSFNPQKADVDLHDLCRKISHRLDQQSLSHQIIWDFQGDSEPLTTDAQLLEMIVSNLMSNAYHYSPSGSTVSVRWGVNGDTMWLCVEDQGPGIDEQEVQRIFQPFVQGSVRRHGAIHGSGVGLAIVSESVDKLGGRIDVESRPGCGSRFILHFPLTHSLTERHS